MTFTLQFLAAVFLDFLIGDPRSIPHPVRGIGLLCEWYQKAYRKLFTNKRWAGGFSFLSVLACTVLPLTALFFCLHLLSPAIESTAAVFVLYTAIAYRDLRVHSMNVYDALSSPEGLPAARRELGMIVGRDTSELDEQGICRACVETVSENMVDGIISPLFFAILFACFAGSVSLSAISLAAIGAYFYKAINTMDSMYGYKNEQYAEFGRTAARMDDLANFIPARISGILLVLAAFVLRLDYKQSFGMFLRDRLEHASPNGGHPEAAVAGALGIQLGGPVRYFGKYVEKPTMGDNLRPLAPSDISAVNRMMLVGSVIFLVVAICCINSVL